MSSTITTTNEIKKKSKIKLIILCNRFRFLCSNRACKKLQIEFSLEKI